MSSIARGGAGAGIDDDDVGSPAVSGRKRGRRAMDDSQSDATGGERRKVRRVEEEEDEEEEEEGEDLFDDNMEDDYRSMGMLDEYDPAMLDEREYGGMDLDTRRAAEAMMLERDRKEGRGRPSRLAAALESDEEASDDGEGFRARQRRRAQMAAAAAMPGMAVEVEEEGDVPFNLESFQGPLRDWTTQPQTKAEVKRRFRSFLEHYTLESGERKYDAVINDMAASNGQSLTISYLHLSHHSPILAIWLADVPKEMLKLFDEVAYSLVLSRYPEYYRIAPEVKVRVKDLPLLDSIRDMRHVHLNAFVRVSGVVTRRTGVFPQLKHVFYRCTKCGCSAGPFVSLDSGEAAISTCPECQQRGPFTVDHERSIYGNYQKITLQEAPGSVPPGRVPRYKEVIMLGDLIDVARPGEEVEITGVYTHTFDANLNARQGFPVFTTVIEANYVAAKTDKRASEVLSEEERREIEALSQQPNIVQRITKSIAPSIFGHDGVKLAIALSMFGGVEKNINEKHRIRGDINVLMVGDPGVAKSQFLKYVEKTAPRAVYTTGKGASAVGLTAAVHKDPVTGEWTLEGGALVLADRGVCLIDEFDKMNDADRTSIHEAMEQQSISISKAGIVTTLQARCAVMAAANPIGGRYDIAKTFSENVQLTDPILTRFDILCVMRDEADEAVDERLATFVVDSHTRSHPTVQAVYKQALSTSRSEAAAYEEMMKEAGPVLSRETASDVEPISQDLLRKYVMVAKETLPSLASIDQDKVSRLYAAMRKESEISGGIPIAVRHVESMMRMAEAAARMRLSSSVSPIDVDISIKVMLDSFISAQKFSVMRQLRRQFAKYVEAGADQNQLCLVKLRELVRESKATGYVRSGGYTYDHDDLDRVEVRVSDLMERAQRHGIDPTKVREFLSSKLLRESGFAYHPDRKVVTQMF